MGQEVALLDVKSQGYLNKRSIDSANTVLMIDLSYLKSKTLRFFLQELGLKICPEMQPYGSKSVKFLRLREQNDTTYARRTKGKSVKLKSNRFHMGICCYLYHT